MNIINYALICKIINVLTLCPPSISYILLPVRHLPLRAPKVRNHPIIYFFELYQLAVLRKTTKIQMCPYEQSHSQEDDAWLPYELDISGRVIPTDTSGTTKTNPMKKNPLSRHLISTKQLNPKNLHTISKPVSSDYSSSAKTEKPLNPHKNLIRDLSKIQEENQHKQINFISANKSLANFFKSHDTGEIIVLLVLPLIFTSWLSRCIHHSISAILNEKFNKFIDKYANEMIYFNNDIEELELCHRDYQRKLLRYWRKKSKLQHMLKMYIELHVKKISVSPNALRSLSHVFNIYRLTEPQVAFVLAEIGSKFIKNKDIASAQKLLFYGDVIFQTPKAHLLLVPLRNKLAEFYHDDMIDGNDVVKEAQEKIGLIAYKAVVEAEGRNQINLTSGYDLLGLTTEQAQKIWMEVKKNLFH